MIRLSGRTVSLIVPRCVGVLLVASCFVVLLVLWMFALGRGPSPSQLFQRIVIRPIPNSVQAIEADVCYESPLKDRLTGWYRHTYLLRFDIGKEDLSKILASDSFRELGDVWYRSGILGLGVASPDIGHFTLYKTREEEPSWVDLERWRDTKAWIAENERKGSWYKAHIVLYSEQLARAYFLEHETTGEWIGTRRIITSQD